VRLDVDAVVTMATAVVDAEGIDALTIRHLAQELGVTPTALYWHFADKQALLDAVADQLWRDALARIDTQRTDDVWTQLRASFAAMISVFDEHPDLAALAPTRVLECEAGLDLSEGVLGLLAQAGFDERGAANAARLLLSSAVMLVTSQPGAAVPDADERAQLMRNKRARLMTLDPARYPRIEAVADYLIDCDDETGASYDLGVDLLMAGLKASVR
jgi:AcrR family transcriptional regulator